MHQAWSSKEKCLFKKDILNDAIHFMQRLLKDIDHIRLSIDNCAAKDDVLSLNEIEINENIEIGDVESILQLWKDEKIQGLYRECDFQSRKYEYSLDNFERIGAQDYIPTEQDIVRTSLKNVIIEEKIVPVHNLNYKVFRLCGLSTEQKNWIHCFEKVDIVTFLTDCSNYDRKHDMDCNTITESLKLFGWIVNSTFFQFSTMVLLLNKTDMFEKKIIGRPIRNYYGQCAVGDYEGSKEFVRMLFLNLSEFPDRYIHSHFICATDAGSVKDVLGSITVMMARKRLQEITLE
jgi:guanine nucleotide-binding protein subunit alpha